MPQYIPPQYPPAPAAPRHGRTFGILAAVVAVVATAIGVGAATLGHQQSDIAGPGTAGSVRPVDSQTAPQSLDEAVRRVVPGIVLINTEILGFDNRSGEFGNTGEGAGTGIVLSADGNILTNNHVVEGSRDISVTDVGNGRTYKGTVTGYDRTDDLAVVHLTGASGLAVAPLGNSDDVGPGDSIVGVGNAGGNGSPVAAPGTVTATGKSITASDESGAAEQLTGLIQVAADIQPGDSGGPLVDKNGQVVGIDTAASQGFKMGTGGGEGFAIPINKGVKIAQQIQAGTASNTVHIGPTAALSISVTSAHGTGALVNLVDGNGPAAAAGLQKGDVITGVDNTLIDSPTSLTSTMDQHHPGDTVTLHWNSRLGGPRTAQITLQEGPIG
ncbi:PDZ domain-containing protein [Nocardia stercoris]|uniref:PDZ domain-containing protein n=2 Tax=Nocardia stercoris TaxID=2483361 RepID=A0A3M2LDX6_9NOCA|nr:PDZ domain-containing protein [Nocardia stercoris]